MLNPGGVGVTVARFESAPPPLFAWFPGERAALTLPTDQTVSQWAEAHREFPKDASFPGRWDPHKAPYAVGPMDAFNDPRVERITLMASARSVKTECWLNMLGYVICQDPGPVLVVAPTETKVKRICKRITKMIKASPELRKYLTGNPDDLQKKSIVLKHMEIIFATAGSASDLGEFEARYVFETETDKYPETAGGYGAPTQMAEMRARTFFNRKIITDCNPTQPEGFIATDYERSDRRKYWLPCPICGGYQVLDFFRVKHRGEQLMAWPKHLQQPEYINQSRPAVYECRYCAGEIEERHKAWMLSQGIWSTQPADITGFLLEEGEGKPDGTAPEAATPAVHVGFWWNTLNSPFASWQEAAAKFFEVKGDREQLKTFYNEWLGLAWKEVVHIKAACSLVEGEDSLVTWRPMLEVPDNTVALTLGADNHKRGIAAAIWAWERLAPKVYNQHLIRYGWLADFLELEAWLFDDVYYNQAGSLGYRVWRAALDTGGGEGYSGDATLTTQAYEWLRRWGHTNRVFGIKGASGRLKSGKRLEPSLRDKMPGGKPIAAGLKMWHLDTHGLKDDFWSKVEMGRVFFHAGAGEDFARQLTAEAREWDPKKKQWLWVQQGNRPNHYLDASIYAGAMADPDCWGGLNVLPTPVPAVQTASPQSGRGDINPVTGLPRGTFLR